MDRNHLSLPVRSCEHQPFALFVEGVGREAILVSAANIMGEIPK
jgi:hypothetical protein